MRLRPTAAVIVGALALALPAAAPSLADDHGERALGTLHYRYLDASGATRNGQIRPADNDTCYVLTRTSRDEPAIEVRNETESLAVLFDNRSCEGEAEAVLKPGGRAKRVEVVSVYLKPADREDTGRGDNGGNVGNGGNGTWPGRGDQGRDDETGQTPADELPADGDQGNEGGNGGNGTWPGRGDQDRDDESDQIDETDETDQSDQNQNRDDEEEEEGFVARILRALR
ncbi:hypothetical protein ACIF8W_10875 [Streptomyces sp. NPDC085639]|uniref:hypothetical protein n=1 Tax=Streptomyces sp. NPDC085639 TaxID=3365734 RepID=UPI0037CE098C